MRGIRNFLLIILDKMMVNSLSNLISFKSIFSYIIRFLTMLFLWSSKHCHQTQVSTFRILHKEWQLVGGLRQVLVLISSIISSRKFFSQVVFGTMSHCICPFVSITKDKRIYLWCFILLKFAFRFNNYGFFFRLILYNELISHFAHIKYYLS